MGRPTKLNPATQEAIVDAISDGMYESQAAQTAGIDESTFHRWMARGREEPDTPFSEFRKSVKRARAEAERDKLTVINTAADAGTWQAAAWWLERSFPKRWGRRTEIALITHDMVRKSQVAFEEGAGQLWLELEIARLEAELGVDPADASP